MAKKTYAQEAKAIMNKYKLRLGDKFDKNDPFAREAMNQ
jgi:ribosomal protein S17E